MNLYIKDMISEEKITFIERKGINWDEAIKIAARPLVEEHIVNENYVNKMFSNVIELGPYINIAKNFAMPHARPEDGANSIGMSLLILDEPVFLLDNPEYPVKIFLCLACKDSTTHLEVLADLADFLGEEENLLALGRCKTKDQVLKLIGKGKCE